MYFKPVNINIDWEITFGVDFYLIYYFSALKLHINVFILSYGRPERDGR